LFAGFSIDVIIDMIDCPPSSLLGGCVIGEKTEEERPSYYFRPEELIPEDHVDPKLP
jgi:hypothetical protein